MLIVLIGRVLERFILILFRRRVMFLHLSRYVIGTYLSKYFIGFWQSSLQLEFNVKFHLYGYLYKKLILKTLFEDCPLDQKRIIRNWLSSATRH